MKSHQGRALIRVFGLALVLLNSASVACRAQPGFQSANKQILPVQMFDLADVKLLDGPFRDAQERDKQYILRIEVDRLMHWFRMNNGLPSSAKPYGDWNQNEYMQQGHFQGHYLSACAQMYRNTGDVRFKERLDAVVAILAQCQRSNGFVAVFPESWVRHHSGLERLPGVSGDLPELWYASHKIYAGLLDAYELGGNHQALDLMIEAARWAEQFTTPLSDEQMQRLLNKEHGGINDSFANLYAITGDPAHLKLAQRFCHRAVLVPLASGNDVLDNLHANTQVPKFIGFARLYELTGERSCHDAAQNFWSFVVRERSYANGGNSDHEHFTPKTHLSWSLSPNNTETCNTYNMLKLTRHLFTWSPDAAAMDYYERAQLNHILSSQHPETGEVMYFHSLQSGNRKGSYSAPRVTMVCCHASGMENHATYASTIYAHNGSERLFVNLFIASEVAWRDAGLTVRQETKFPEAGFSQLTVAATNAVNATISIRKPAWAGGGFAVTVNGQPVSAVAGSDGYVNINRVWRNGDMVSLTLPMTLRWEGFQDNPDRAAVFSGPVLLVAETTEGARFSTVRGAGEAALTSMKSSGPPLHFTSDDGLFKRDLAATNQSVRFLPMYQAWREPYIVYWDRVDEHRWTEWAAGYEAEKKRWVELAPRTVDVVFPGMGIATATNDLPGRFARDPLLPQTAGVEANEKQHRLEAFDGWNKELNLFPRQTDAGLWQTFRTAEKGSDYFGWTLKVIPGKPQSLLVRLWNPSASDPEQARTNGTLQVWGAAIGESVGSTNRGNEGRADHGILLGVVSPTAGRSGFSEMRLTLPPELTRKVEQVRIRFVRPPDQKAAMVGEVRIVEDSDRAIGANAKDEGVSIPQTWARRGLVIKRASESGGVSGDPCIVWDEEIKGWRMVLFYDPPGNAQAVCTNLNDLGPGQWTMEGPLPATNPKAVGEFHKPFLVMNPHEPNRAAKIDGRFCLLVINSKRWHKQVQRAWSEHLAGPWTFEDEPIIVPGPENPDFDAKHADAVTGYYFPERKEFLYFYMGYPREAQLRKISPFGSAQAVAIQKLGERKATKRGIILEPCEQPGHWASGWVGGLQLLPGKEHRWIAVVNASPTAPDPSKKDVWTEEPPPSLGGFAWCDEEWPVRGWHFAPEPIERVKDIPKDALDAGEGYNLWRQFIHVLPDGRAALFYNSGCYGREQLYLKVGSPR